MTIREFCRQYTDRDDRIATIELVWTVAAYCAAVYGAIAFAPNWWITAPLMLVIAATGVRIYMLQHDCIHGTLFSSRRLNDVVGTLLSPIALTPYQATKYAHNRHHAYVSDLDHRDAFEIHVMTVAEYETAPLWKKLQYRLYRSAFTLVFTGPFLMYMVLRRFPKHAFKTGIWDVILHDLMIAAYFFGVYLWAGWLGLGVLLGAIYIGCTLGVLIPYVVHNFEHIEWGRRPDMDFETAALKGSSVLNFGWFFDFMTFNIAYHDLHHLNANIPSYHIKRCHQDLEAAGLIESTKIGLWEAIKCLRWKLYDEPNSRMVPFPPLMQDMRSASGVVPAE
ncbi:fatty acid desaturase [Shimia ponticola]|uniref:fatty acid desaturase n=1 Tax=Shimia ponticola TaxID=2582893 RepID=UPI0011BF2052|nr:fatty acid desaturase [Shimia ponticola]